MGGEGHTDLGSFSQLPARLDVTLLQVVKLVLENVHFVSAATTTKQKQNINQLNFHSNDVTKVMTSPQLLLLVVELRVAHHGFLEAVLQLEHLLLQTTQQHSVTWHV